MVLIIETASAGQTLIKERDPRRANEATIGLRDREMCRIGLFVSK
jgi:hypothetical protein